jgi:hypothetical protein
VLQGRYLLPDKSPLGCVVKPKNRVCLVNILAVLSQNRIRTWLRLGLSIGISLFLLSCGNGSTVIHTPPPTGNFSNASLNGQYVYSLSGNALISASSNSSAPYSESGVFTADGNGHLTNGTDDFAQNGNFASNPFTGTYSLNRDGTGTMTLTFLNGAGSFQLGVTLVNSSQFYLIETDSFATGGGSAEKQDPSAFSAAPSGVFAFLIHATGASSNVGAMTITGGTITGNEDVLASTGLTSPTLGGSVTAPLANGRGTLTLTNSNGNTSNFAYYMVNANTLRLMQTDSGVLGLGRAEKETAATFSPASLTGSFAFGSNGDTPANNGGVHSVGLFTCDGNGNITAGAYDSVKDSNQTTNVGLTGSYTISSAGRAALTLNLQNGIVIQDVLWMVSPTRGFVLVNDSSKLEDGTLDQQQSSSFSTSSLNGQLAFVMDGFDTASLVDRVGTLQTDGKGNISLNELLNRGGTVSAPGLLPGTYTVGSNGRVVGTVSSLSNNLVFYMISGNSGYLLQNDAGAEIAGTAAHQ